MRRKPLADSFVFSVAKCREEVLIWFKRSYYVNEARLDHHTALRFR